MMEVYQELNLRIVAHSLCIHTLGVNTQAMDDCDRAIASFRTKITTRMNLVLGD